MVMHRDALRAQRPGDAYSFLSGRGDVIIWRRRRDDRYRRTQVIIPKDGQNHPHLVVAPPRASVVDHILNALCSRNHPAELSLEEKVDSGFAIPWLHKLFTAVPPNSRRGRKDRSGRPLHEALVERCEPPNRGQ